MCIHCRHLVQIVPSCNCILFLSLLQLLMKEKRETKDMKDEAEKYQKTLQELADHEIQEKLFKLFHAEQDIQLAEGELKEKQQELSDLVRGGEGERGGEGKRGGGGEGRGRGGEGRGGEGEGKDSTYQHCIPYNVLWYSAYTV